MFNLTPFVLAVLIRAKPLSKTPVIEFWEPKPAFSIHPPSPRPSFNYFNIVQVVREVDCPEALMVFSFMAFFVVPLIAYVALSTPRPSSGSSSKKQVGAQEPVQFAKEALVSKTIPIFRIQNARLIRCPIPPVQMEETDPVTTVKEEVVSRVVPLFRLKNVRSARKVSVPAPAPAPTLTSEVVEAIIEEEPSYKKELDAKRLKAKLAHEAYLATKEQKVVITRKRDSGCFVEPSKEVVESKTTCEDDEDWLIGEQLDIMALAYKEEVDSWVNEQNCSIKELCAKEEQQITAMKARKEDAFITKQLESIAEAHEPEIKQFLFEQDCFMAELCAVERRIACQEAKQTRKEINSILIKLYLIEKSLKQELNDWIIEQDRPIEDLLAESEIPTITVSPP